MTPLERSKYAWKKNSLADYEPYPFATILGGKKNKSKRPPEISMFDWIGLVFLFFLLATLLVM